MYFLAQFWCFKIFALWKGCYQSNCLTGPNSQSILQILSFSTPSTPEKIWELAESGFAITRFSLCSSRGNKFLKPFQNIFSTAFFNIWWYLQSFFDISKVDIFHSITFLFSVFQQLLDPSLFLSLNIYYEHTEKKFRFHRSSELIII